VADSQLSPLQHNVQIVNPDGTPTPYFIQLLQQLYEEKNDISDQVELTAGLDLIAGAGLTGGGPLDGSAGDITLSANVQAILNLVTTTRGAILYRGAAVWSALLPGTSGDFLKTNGAGADPAWATPGGGGGSLVLLEQHTAAASASLDFTAGITALYDEYIFELVNVLNTTNSAIPWIRMSTNGGVSYDAAANYQHYFHSRSLATFSGNGSVADTKIQMNNNGHVNTFNYGIGGQFRLFSPLSTTQHKAVNGSFVACDGGGSGWISDCQFSGRYMSLTAVNAIRFMFSAGNITSGTIRMYGIAK
jgi:hypothetical protein